MLRGNNEDETYVLSALLNMIEYRGLEVQVEMLHVQRGELKIFSGW